MHKDMDPKKHDKRHVKGALATTTKIYRRRVPRPDVGGAERLTKNPPNERMRDAAASDICKASCGSGSCRLWRAAFGRSAARAGGWRAASDIGARHDAW